MAAAGISIAWPARLTVFVMATALGGAAAAEDRHAQLQVSAQVVPVCAFSPENVRCNSRSLARPAITRSTVLVPPSDREPIKDTAAYRVLTITF